MITGGLGDIGVALAIRLAREGHRVALISRRSGRPDALEPLGDDLLCLQADVAEPVQLVRALADVRLRWGSINVVIHAAGMAGSGTIALRPTDGMRAVLAPKVTGTEVLLAAVAEDNPAVVLCSSMASWAGSFGQADYAAANAYMDAVAVRGRGAGRRIVALSLPTWRDIGMAVRAEVPSRRSR